MKALKTFLSIVLCCIIAMSSTVIGFAVDIVPTKYSSVEKGYITPVKSQGITGTCWAFVAASMLEADAIKKGYYTLEDCDFSEAHIVWLANTTDGTEEYDHVMTSEPYNCAGNVENALITIRRNAGLNDEENYPFDGINTGNMGNYPESARRTTNGYTVDEIRIFNDLNEVKNWVIDHGAVSIDYYYNNEYLRVMDGNVSYCCDIDYRTNHVATVVGWDDNYSKDNFKYKPSHNGAWLVKNSWGKNWGDNGYCWISYEDISIHEYIGCTIREVKDTNNTYTRNNISWALSGEFVNPTCCNIYTVNGEETLSKVGFYTFQENITADVKVVCLDEQYMSPTGKIIFQNTINCHNIGYYTMECNGQSLIEGRDYAVMVSFSDPQNESSTCKVNIEYLGSDEQYEAEDGYNLYYHCEKNKSYISYSRYDEYNDKWTSSGYTNFEFYIDMYTEGDAEKCNRIVTEKNKKDNLTDNDYSDDQIDNGNDLNNVDDKADEKVDDNAFYYADNTKSISWDQLLSRLIEILGKAFSLLFNMVLRLI